MDPALGSFSLIGLLEPLLPFLEQENMIFGESLMNGDGVLTLLLGDLGQVPLGTWLLPLLKGANGGSDPSWPR